MQRYGLYLFFHKKILLPISRQNLIFQISGLLIGGYSIKILFFSRSNRIINIIMGKKTNKQSTYVTASTFKIKKNKTSIANLQAYVKLLKAKYSNISTKEYLSYVHKYIKKLAQVKGGFEENFVVQTKSMIQICQRCDKWAMGSKKIIQCYRCQDSYHISCAKKYTQKDKWLCQMCTQIQEHSQNEAEMAPIQIVCSKCHQNKNQLTVKCLRCNNFFHKLCFGRQSIVCGGCDAKIEAKLSKVKQLTLRESFQNAQIYSSKKKQKINKELQGRQRRSSKNKADIQTQKQQQKTELTKPFSKQINQNTNSTVIISNSKIFRSAFPKMTQQQINFYKQKLLYAIQTKNMNYNEQLVCHKCSLFDNNEDSLDFALSQLSISDFRIYKEYKRQPIGPFLLQYKQGMGYDVVADKDLPKGMIVCEYVGDVYTFRETIKINQNEQNDSLMQLTFGKNADESLFIVPRKFTNIARFLNGVNLKDPNKKQKENVKTCRSMAQGKPVVILYTSRCIKKGESLLYDYGAGGANNYDTSQYK